MKQIFTLTVQGESEVEVLACLAKMNSEAALSVIVGQIGAGCISDGSYPTVQWTYRAAVTPENARIALNQRESMTPEAVKAYEAAARQADTRKLYTVDIHSTDNDYDALALLTEDEATKIEAKLEDQFRTQCADSINGEGVEIAEAEAPLDFTTLTSWLDGVAEDIEPTHDSEGEPLDG